jgi:hypothetical protein
MAKALSILVSLFSHINRLSEVVFGRFNKLLGKKEYGGLS